MAITDAGGVEYTSGDAFYDYILNDIFLPAVADTVITPNTLLERLPRDKERVEGKNVVFPIHIGRNIGVNSIAAGGDLPDPGQQDYDQYSFGLKHLYGRIKFDGVSADASRTQMAAWLKAIESEVRGLGIDMSRYKQRAYHGNGMGVVGQINGPTAATDQTLADQTDLPETSATISPDFNRAKYLRVGQRLGLVSLTAVGGNTVGQIYDIRTVGSVDRTLGSEEVTFTVALSANGGGAAGNNYGLVLISNDSGVAADSSYNNEPMGIAGIVDDGNPGNSTSFQGIDATDLANDWHRATVQSSGTARDLTINLMDKAFTTAMETGDAAPTALVTSFGVARKYASLLLAERRYMQTGTASDLDGGYKALDYNGVPMIADRDCLNNRIYFLHEPDLRIYVLSDPQWMNKDGSIYHRLPDKDAYQATMYCRETMGTDVRDKHVLLAAINEV